MPTEMNHDEIWDDSALIESWNDALTEYKVSSQGSHHPTPPSALFLTSGQKYHSIHAKGGSVDDLPPNEPESVHFEALNLGASHIVNLVHPSLIPTIVSERDQMPSLKREAPASLWKRAKAKGETKRL
jgi:hypothetical protein